MRLHASPAGAAGSIPAVGELRSYKLCSAVKKVKSRDSKEGKKERGKGKRDRKEVERDEKGEKEKEKKCFCNLYTHVLEKINPINQCFC